jgi:hypothetical protein
MNAHDKIRNLPENVLASGWITNLKKGDSFKLNGDFFEVTCHTAKTFRIKSNRKTLSFKYYGSTFLPEGKHANFFRDVEGVLMTDCINEFNKFHEPSDFFKIYEKELDKN